MQKNVYLGAFYTIIYMNKSIILQRANKAGKPAQLDRYGLGKLMAL